MCIAQESCSAQFRLHWPLTPYLAGGIIVPRFEMKPANGIASATLARASLSKQESTICGLSSRS